MKILFSDWTLPYLLKDANFPVGGWAVELSSWISGLEACDCEVEVLTWLGANEYVGEPSRVQLREAYRREGGLRILKYFYHHIPAIADATRRSAPDVVIQACSGVETAIMAFAAWRAGAVYLHRLATDRDVDERIVGATRRYERLAFRWGMSRTDAIVCQNNYQLDRVRILYPDKPATVIHNPFQVPAGAAQLGHGSRDYIAWIANFGPAKNLPLLQQVATLNPAIEFRVAGGFPGLATDETRAAVRSLEGLPNVRMMGYLSRERVPAFLASARYLLSTSLFEGMSNTFLEALSVGTPILAPSRVDPDGIVASFGLGFAVPSDEELIMLPRFAIATPDDAFRDMSARCRRYVVEHHDPSLIATRLLEFLDEHALSPARRLGVAA